MHKRTLIPVILLLLAAGTSPLSAQQPDLTFYQAPLWDAPLVPTSSASATYDEAHVSPTLPGNAYSTYFSYRARNAGDTGTTTNTAVAVQVDGVPLLSVTHGTIGPFTHFYHLNSGVFYVHCGRHTLTAMVDAQEAIAESNEDNNWTGAQYIWNPLTLTPGNPISINPPPPRTGGWSHASGTLWFNCDGRRFSSTGWWNALTVYASDPTEDYDCRLHDPSSGSSDGFASNLAYSSNGAGYLDAVIVNRNTMGEQDWDVGLLNVSGGSSSTVIQLVQSPGLSLAPGDTGTVSFGDREMLKLYELYIASADTGYVGVKLETPANGDPLSLAWFDKGITTGTLGSFQQLTFVNPGTTGGFQLHVPESGFYCVAVYRNPVNGTAPTSAFLSITPAMPELTPIAPPGWYAPLVPRPADDGTLDSVAMPDTLYGNSASTYFNLAAANLGAAESPSLDTDILVDGGRVGFVNWNSVPAGETRRYNWGYAFSIHGGRHTVALKVDPADDVAEFDETNNVFGDQYVWSPLPLTDGASVYRTAPLYHAGWDDILYTAPFHYNCDGLRMPATGWWHAVAVMPADTDEDVDVALYANAPGARDGFADVLVQSASGGNFIDYVLVNNNVAPLAPHDVGVFCYYGSGNYTAQSVVSVNEGNASNGLEFGPNTIGPGQMIDLHDIYMAAGSYTIHLANVAGAVDWAMGLHPADQPYQAAFDPLIGDPAYLNGNGEDEYLTLSVPADGWYCLVVSKLWGLQLTDSGTYRVTIHAGMTGADDTPGLVTTGLTAVRPNPFNPRTVIGYRLADDTTVELGVYDLAGARVRTLVSGPQAAGPHRATWDGTDDAGRRLASGTYMVRLRAGGVNDLRKVMLVK